MVSSSGHQATSTRVSTRMMSVMGMERCAGLMGHSMWESGHEGFNMDRGK